MLLRLERELQAGKEPSAASHGEAYRIRPLDAVDDEADFGSLLQEYQDRVRIPV